MRDTRRRQEIKAYYLGISADEITSYFTPATFDLWQALARYRSEHGIGARWLEVGGGLGELAAAALDRGYDVLMTDVQPELLDSAAARHPSLLGRLERSDIFDRRDVTTLAARGPFSIVAALGAVLNHARDHRELARGFGHLVGLAAPNALLIVDVMLREMFPGHPATIWADIFHVLPGFDDLARLVRASRLQVLEAHSLYHRYPPTPAFDAEFDERMLRLVLHRTPSDRGASGTTIRSSRRARPDSRRRAPSPSRDSAGARPATRRRRRA